MRDPFLLATLCPRLCPRRIYEYAPVVYFHERAWENLDDALGLIRCVSVGFHNHSSYGMVCMGPLRKQLLDNTISVEDAFWTSTNVVYEPDIPFMVDSLKQKDWLKNLVMTPNMFDITSNVFDITSYAPPDGFDMAIWGTPRVVLESLGKDRT